MQYKVGVGKYNDALPELPKKGDKIKFAEKNDTLEERVVLDISTIKGRKNRVVYTIETEKNHNYFANGVLVKNSGYFPWSAFIESQPTLNTFTPGHKMIVSGVPDGRREKSVCFHADQENSSYSKHSINALENPRFTEEDKIKAIEQYGNEDSEDYIHLVLGQHGKPVFSLFDRSTMLISNDPVYYLEMNGVNLGQDLTEYLNRLATFPGLPSKEDKVIMGVDLGYTEPTAITINYLDKNGRIHFHGRIKLSKVAYPIQEKLIDFLDTKYEPLFIGVDRGSSGINVIHHLQMDAAYSMKNYEKRVKSIDFSSYTSMGFDADGNEIKIKTKPLSVQVLQDYTNNHKIVYSSTDLEMIVELERMTYTKTPSGEIIYRTLTARGGQKGEDHFTAALLCEGLAYYLENDSFTPKQKVKRLFRPTWL